MIGLFETILNRKQSIERNKSRVLYDKLIEVAMIDGGDLGELFISTEKDLKVAFSDIPELLKLKLVYDSNIHHDEVMVSNQGDYLILFIECTDEERLLKNRKVILDTFKKYGAKYNITADNQHNGDKYFMRISIFDR